MTGGRGTGGRAWWSARLLEIAEGMSLPDPLRAGRALVRTEAVLSVRRTGNLVVAMVRDQQEELHKARLAVRPFTATDWGRIEEALAAQARYAAVLLAGSMPVGLEKAVGALGLSLFPTRADDLAMDCTCADWQRPCAHLVASFYQLADEVDLDPFTLLALRGRERDALLGEIRRLRPAAAPEPGTDGQPHAWPPPAAARLSAPTVGREGEAPVSGQSPTTLPNTVSEFWSSPVPVPTSAGPREAGSRPAPARPDVLLDLCGPLAAEPGGDDLRGWLRPAYLAFSRPVA